MCLVGAFWLHAMQGVAAEPAASVAWVDCPTCKGTGVAACPNAECVKGKALCPAPCLKKERGEWVHLKVAGHADSELWQKFRSSPTSYEAWNQSHLGERIELVNGKFTNTGKCPVCKGTTRVECSICHGDPTCKRCKGAGQLPASEAAPARAAGSGLSIFRTKDGDVYEGTVMARNAAFVMIKTAEGKTVKLATKNLVEERPEP